MFKIPPVGTRICLTPHLRGETPRQGPPGENLFIVEEKGGKLTSTCTLRRTRQGRDAERKVIQVLLELDSLAEKERNR